MTPVTPRFVGGIVLCMGRDVWLDDVIVEDSPCAYKTGWELPSKNMLMN
jgi:hypothetical protein